MSASHPTGPGLSRRAFLAGSAGAVAVTLSEQLAPPALIDSAQAATTTGRRAPGSLPYPHLAAGTDTMPGIEQIVILMMENHSYDNFFGMLGRGPGQTPRGDGFTIGADGRPTATNPYPDGRIQLAFRMPTTCQLPGRPSQEWSASHHAYNGGRNDGFVSTPISPATTEIVGGVAMGYWTGEDLPFTYGLAEVFPIGDRWFCSVLGQTDPNRRYLIAATSAGMVDDIGTSPGNAEQDALLTTPAPAGTIFNQLDRHGISWTDYVYSYPTGATPELFVTNDAATEANNHKAFSQFFTDAAAGKLPSVVLLDENFSTQSQENPQNIVEGEAMMAQVVRAIGASPQWSTTLLVIVWDEHGGYYDHVPPPVAVAPDDIPPVVEPTESTYDGFARYGFRVPSVVVSAYAKPGYVSHTVYDHTSILAMIERKWNLPALTYRDANANDLTDFLDMSALASRRPTFATLPSLPAAGDTPAALACSTEGPGVIPPADSVLAAPGGGAPAAGSAPAGPPAFPPGSPGAASLPRTGGTSATAEMLAAGAVGTGAALRWWSRFRRAGREPRPDAAPPPRSTQ
ncbi:MAG: alkaline phosphatase family protein [Acidimicrobiales bacterium]